jgi:hypothetical protein
MLAGFVSCTVPVPSHLCASGSISRRSQADNVGLSAPATEPASVAVPDISRTIRVKIASQRAEFEQAFSLLSAKYRARGYEEPSPKLFRFTPFHALPGTITFVAKIEDQVVATLSLVTDNAQLGLPMEAIYGEEIADLRAQGRRLAEVTSLADEGLSPREFRQVFNSLISLAMQYHLGQGGDSWVITVNPRHSGYYRKVLGFESLGGLKHYHSVQGHPAEAHILDVDLMRDNAPKMHRAILGTPLPEAVLSAPRRTADHARYFGEQSTQIEQEQLADLIGRVEQGGDDLPRWTGRGGRGAA